MLGFRLHHLFLLVCGAFADKACRIPIPATALLQRRTWPRSTNGVQQGSSLEWEEATTTATPTNNSKPIPQPRPQPRPTPRPTPTTIITYTMHPSDYDATDVDATKSTSTIPCDTDKRNFHAMKSLNECKSICSLQGAACWGIYGRMDPRNPGSIGQACWTCPPGTPPSKSNNQNGYPYWIRGTIQLSPTPIPPVAPKYAYHCCKTNCDQQRGVPSCKKIDNTPILNIGNSYTYYNWGVNDALCSLLKSAGYSRQCGRLAKGGWTLNDHWEKMSSWRSYTREFETKKGGFVIVQDASYRPAHLGGREKSLPALKGIDERIEARGATTVLYSTWGYRDEFSDPTSGNDKVGEGYEHYALSISRSARKPLIAPVGRAFGLIYDEIRRRGESPKDKNSDFYRLYDPDGTHPSVRGTYLAACVMFGTITGQHSMGKSSWRLSTNDAEALQATADQAVFQTHDTKG